jgi:hypothetical protein
MPSLLRSSGAYSIPALHRRQGGDEVFALPTLQTATVTFRVPRTSGNAPLAGHRRSASTWELLASRRCIPHAKQYRVTSSCLRGIQGTACFRHPLLYCGICSHHIHHRLVADAVQAVVEQHQTLYFPRNSIVNGCLQCSSKSDARLSSSEHILNECVSQEETRSEQSHLACPEARHRCRHHERIWALHRWRPITLVLLCRGES